MAFMIDERNYADINRVNYQPPTAPQPLPGLWDAAFRLENDVFNAAEYLSRPRFQADPNFDWDETSRKSSLFNIRPEAFIGVQSEAEWAERETRLGRELTDAAAIQAAGWKGVAAAMVAGMVSPTVLLPGGAAVTAPTKLQGAARVAGWSMFGAGVSEGMLHSNQLTRTAMDSAVGIGGAAVLGGILGGAIRWIDPLQIDKMASDMATIGPKATIQPLVPRSDTFQSTGAKAPSAAAIPTVNVAGAAPAAVAPQAPRFSADDISSAMFEFDLSNAAKLGEFDFKMEDGAIKAYSNDVELANFGTDMKKMQEFLQNPPASDGSLSAARVENPEAPPPLFKDPEGLFWVPSANTLAHLGPITRGIALGLTKTRRAVTAQFGNAGLLTKAAARGEAVAPDGDVESRVKGHYSAFAKLNQQMQQDFKAYWLAKGGTTTGASFRKAFASGGYVQFLEEVGDGIRYRVEGASHSMPEVDAAAQKIIAQLYTPKIDEARAVGLPPFNKMSPDYALRIMTQRVKQSAIAAEYDVARQMLIENALMILSKGKVRIDELLEDGIFKTEVIKALKAKGQDPNDLDIAEGIADQILDKLMGRNPEHGTIDILSEIGEKAAKFLYMNPYTRWSNGRIWNEFLERDSEKLMRGFTRSMAPNIELQRTFGTNRPDVADADKVPFWREFNEELQVEYEKAAGLPEKQRLARHAELQKEYNAFKQDLEVLVGRLRHTHGAPADPGAWPTRLGRWALQLNTMRLMGSVVISSIPDMARPVLKYGLLNTFRDGLLPMLSDFKTFKMSAAEAREAGVALDVLMHGRASMFADVFDDLEYGNRIDRVMQYGTSRIGIWGLFDYWNTGLKQFSAAIANAKMLRDMQDVVDGKASKSQAAFLASLNIDQAMAEKIIRKIKVEKGGQEVNGVWLPNTEDWTLFDDLDIEVEADRLAREALEADRRQQLRARYVKPADIKSKMEAELAKLPALDQKEAKKKLAARVKAYTKLYNDGSHYQVLGELANWKSPEDIAEMESINWPVTRKDERARLVRDVMLAAGVPSKKNKADFGSWAKQYKEVARIEPGTDLRDPTPKEIEAFKDEAWERMFTKNRDLQRVYRAALAKAVDDTIITPGLERPNWVDASTAGRLIAQFRSFTFSSTFKVALAAAQDARLGNWGQVINGAGISLALGTVSYYLWAQTVGGETRQRMLNDLDGALNGDEDSLARIADEAIARSGLIGVLAEAQKFAERTPGLAEYSTLSGEPLARSPYVQPVWDLLGPSVSALNNINTLVTTADDPTSETFRKGKQLMPFQNLFYMRWALDRVNEAVMDAAGVPYK